MSERGAAEYWLRYHDVLVSCGGDEWGYSYGSRTEIYRTRYRVLKHTPCGVWLNVHGERRFVKNGTRKQFAHPTEAEALVSFKARKRRQIAIYSARIKDAEEALRLAERREMLEVAA